MAKAIPTVTQSEWTAPPQAGQEDIDKAAEIERLKWDLALSEEKNATAIAKIAALEAVNAPPVAGPVCRYLVEVKNGPAWAVESTHEGFAVADYFAATGMTQTTESPVVTRVDDSHPLGKHG